MNKPHTHTSQTGFAHLTLLVFIVLVAVIGFTAGNVYSTQKERQEAARQAAAIAESTKKVNELKAKTPADEQKTVEVPATQPEKQPEPAPASKPAPSPAPVKTEPKPAIYKFTITETSGVVDGSNFIMSAQLGNTYTGTCEVQVKAVDGSSAQWFKSTISNQSTCTVSAPTEKFAGQAWKFYMYYYNDPKNITIKGTSADHWFSIP